MALATIGAIVSLAGAAANLYGALQGPDEMLPENMNREQTVALLRQVNDLIQRNQAGQQVAMEEIDAVQGQLGLFQQQAADIQRQQAALQAPGQNEAYQTFLGRVPELQAIAQSVAQEASSPYRDQQDIAQRRAGEAARMAQAGFAGAGGNLYSGAALAAGAQAAGDQLANYEQGLAQLYGQTYAGQAGQLLGAEQQLARQDVQQEYANEMNRFQALLQNLQGQGAMQGQVGQLAGQQGAIFQDSLNQLRNTQAQLMGPQFATPTFVENQWSGIGAGLAGLGAGTTALGQTMQANQGGGLPQLGNTEPQANVVNTAQPATAPLPAQGYNLPETLSERDKQLILQYGGTL